MCIYMYIIVPMCVIWQVQVLEVTEAVLVQLRAAGPVMHLYIPGIMALITYMLTLLFYDITETFNLPRWEILRNPCLFLQL